MKTKKSYQSSFIPKKGSLAERDMHTANYRAKACANMFIFEFVVFCFGRVGAVVQAYGKLALLLPALIAVNDDEVSASLPRIYPAQLLSTPR